jgi:hypothetical protein
VLDFDIFPTYSSTLLGLLYALTFIMLAQPLKRPGRASMLMALVWMVVLWVGVVSFTASMKYQPAIRMCLDFRSHNVLPMALPSSCAYSYRNTTTSHPMRSGQHAVPVSKPSGYYTDLVHTDHWAIARSVLITLCSLAS